MADGKVIIETGLDITGATKDLNNLGKTIEKEGKEIPPIKPEVKPEVEEKAKTKTKADINSLVEEVNRILKNAKTDVNINVSDEDLNIVSSRIDTILSNTQLVTSEKVQKINAEFKKIGLTGVGENVQKNVADKVEQGMNKTATATNKTTQATNKATKASKNLDKETKDLNKDLKQVGNTGTKSMQQISSGANKSSKSIGGLKASLGKIAGILAAGFSIQALVNMGKESVNLASDLTEVQNVVDTAFGSMSQKMEDFADTAIETYGISKLTAKNIGSTYTAMARGMGQSLDEATDKALEMTGRVADIASFYNLTIDRANTIGRAVYSGETEPLKQIGVIMTEDQLAAFALANGYDTLYKNMNAAQKLEVRQAYFLSQTNLAAGDFVKTQDSWANQTRILSERWKEFLSVLGSGLIQILTPVLKFLNQFVSSMTAALTAFNKFLGINTEVSATGAAGIADIADSMDDVTSSTEAANDAQKDLLGSYDKLNVISQDTSSGAGSGASAGTGVGGLDITETVDTSKSAKDISFLTQVLSNLKSIIDSIDFKPLLTSLDNLKIALIPLGQNIWKGLQWGFNNILIPLATWTIEDYLPTWLNLLATALETLNTVIEVLAPSVQKFWKSVLVPLFTLQGTIIIDTLNVIKTILQWFNDWLKEHSAQIQAFLDNYITPFFSSVVNLLTQLYDFIKNVIIGEILIPLAPLFESVFNAILSIVTTVISGILKVLQGIIDILSGIIEFITGVFTGDWEKALDGLKTILAGVVEIIWGIIKGVIGSIVSIIEGVINIIIDAIRGMIGVLANIIEGIVTIIVDIMETIWGVVKKIINLIVGGINGLISGVQLGVNAVIKALNSLSFDVPDWVPGIGGETFGFNLTEVSLAKIPYLASGAVIPPNKEFMAVLGDQSSGTNIETPLKTMIEAFTAALDARGGSNHEPIILQLPNGKVIAELVWSEEEKRYKQTGSYRPKYS